MVKRCTLIILFCCLFTLSSVFLFRRHLRRNQSVLPLVLLRVRPLAHHALHSTPTVQNVRDIIFNRSVVNVDGSRVGLTDNRIVEKVLGEYDIICIEDVVNEIATLGPHFKEVFFFSFFFSFVLFFFLFSFFFFLFLSLLFFFFFFSSLLFQILIVMNVFLFLINIAKKEITSLYFSVLTLLLFSPLLQCSCFSFSKMVISHFLFSFVFCLDKQVPLELQTLFAVERAVRFQGERIAQRQERCQRIAEEDDLSIKAEPPRKRSDSAPAAKVPMPQLCTRQFSGGCFVLCVVSINKSI